MLENGSDKTNEKHYDLISVSSSVSLLKHESAGGLPDDD